MSKSNPYRIYLATEDKDCLGALLTELFDHFDLLPDTAKSRKQWKRFLNSPYFVEDTRFVPLFEQLFAAYKREAAFVKSAALLPKLFGRNDYQSDAKELSQLIRELQQHILRFCLDQFLQEEKMECAQLQVALARNRARPALFNKLLKRWQKSIEQQPLGTRRMLHQWRLNHHRLISTQRNKHTNLEYLLQQTKQDIQSLAELVSLIYWHDLASVRQLLRSTDTPSILAGDNASTGLLESFRLLKQLRTNKQFNLQAYRYVQERILHYGSTYSKEQHFMLWQLTVNYLSLHYRKGKSYLRKELLFWLEYQLHHDLLKSFPYISGSNLINSLLIACLNNRSEFASELLDTFRVLVLPGERQQAGWHAEVALAFYQHRHTKCLGLLQKYFPRQHMDEYVDASRLKSYRCRSLLCLLTLDWWEHQETFLQALQDFKRYLKRRDNQLSDLKIQFFSNFIDILHRIYRLMQQDVTPASQAELLQDITTCTPLHCRDWLMAFVGTLSFGKQQQLRPNNHIVPQLLSCAFIHR